MSISAGFPKHS